MTIATPDQPVDERDQHNQSLMEQRAGVRLPLLCRSFERLTGKPLVDAYPCDPMAIWTAPIAIIAHDTLADPCFFYGNRLMLALFEMNAEELLGMPSRLSAEPQHRTERDRMFERVKAKGYIDDYAGVRISARGNRFRIENAWIWNIADEFGLLYGQAAAFDKWTPLG